MSLTIRKFEGEKKDQNEKKYQYIYERIVLPWSRVGEDINKEKVTGSVPSLAEILSWAQQTGFTTEVKIETGSDGTDSASGPSVVGFLVEGINAHLNRAAATEAMNTEEAAMESVIQMFMKKRNLTREQAIKKLASIG